MSHQCMVNQRLLVLLTKELSYIILPGIVVPVLPNSSTGSWSDNSQTLPVTKMNLAVEEHRLSPPMDPLDNALTTLPVPMGWRISAQLYPTWQFEWIGKVDCQRGHCSVPTGIQTLRDIPEMLLTHMFTVMFAQTAAFVCKIVVSWITTQQIVY
jgi:hypothetical protein